MTETTTPETFSFSDWFADANLPESSADVYTNGHLLAELTDLQRRISIEGRVVEAEATASSKKAKTVLEDEYVALAQRFASSKITIYLRALTGERRTEIRAIHDAANEPDREFVFRQLAESIYAMSRADGPKVDAVLTVDQVRDLYLRIGDPQITLLYNAFRTASDGIPSVDADFLHKLSGPENGPES